MIGSLSRKYFHLVGSSSTATTWFDKNTYPRARKISTQAYYYSYVFSAMFKRIRFLRKSHLACLVVMLVLMYYTYTQEEKNDITNHVLPVLVIACNRPHLKLCLQSIVKYRPDNNSYPIIVSQGCRHKKTRRIIKSFADSDPTITYVQPDQSDVGPHDWAHLMGYYSIGLHYRLALNHVFRTLQHKAAIIIEDDLIVALDFFEYFRGTYPLLYQDPTIWCVSAWNDNCKDALVDVNEPQLLHRTDFFPGLGWMLLSHTWEELEPQWPESYFDDWLRDPVISRGRVCIRPEISRTFNFGRFGVSNPIFFDRYLRHTILNLHYIPFTRYDLSYLMKKHEHAFFHFVFSQPKTTAAEVMAGTLNSSLKFVRVPYKDADEFRSSAKMFGLMDDLTHGVPRTALRGIVQCFIKGHRVFLAPRLKRQNRQKELEGRPDSFDLIY